LECKTIKQEDESEFEKRFHTTAEKYAKKINSKKHEAYDEMKKKAKEGYKRALKEKCDKKDEALKQCLDAERETFKTKIAELKGSNQKEISDLKDSNEELSGQVESLKEKVHQITEANDKYTEGYCQRLTNWAYIVATQTAEILDNEISRDPCLIGSPTKIPTVIDQMAEFIKKEYTKVNSNYEY